jgi:para-nitrobenzyl esterase
LFHHAIAQSSAVLLPASRHISQTQANHPPLEQDGLKFAEHFNIDNDIHASDRLRQLSAEQVIAVPTQPGSMNPVVDGVFITEDLGKTFNDGNFHPVDYIAGVNSWEASLAKSLASMPAEFLFGLLTKTYGLSGYEQAISDVYGEKTSLAETNQMLFADSFHASSYHLAEQVAKHGGNSYLYWFAYQPQGVDKAIPGVPHGSEVPYIFGSLDQRDRVGSPPVTDKDLKVSQQVQQYWVNFAATGNPNGPNLANWPKMTDQQPNWLIIDETFTTSPDLMESRMKLWQKTYR